MSHRIIIFSFIAILTIPSIAWTFVDDDRKGEITENRILKSMPVLTPRTAKEFPKEFDEFYSDHLPFRNDLIRTFSIIQYKLLGCVESNRVVFGRDGWLFYQKESYFGSPMLTYKRMDRFKREELERAGSRISTLKKTLESAGCRFVLMIAPTKENIYPEYMPAYIRRSEGKSRTEQMIEYLRGKGIEVVYPAEQVTASKNAGNLYYKYDTHWNSLGGYAAAKALLKALDRDLPDPGALGIEPKIIPGTTAKIGQGYDLAKLVGINRILVEPYSYRVSGYAEREPEKLPSSELEDRYACSGGTGKIMMIRDSFGEEMRLPIASRYGESMFMLYYYFKPEMAVKEKPDVFVYEVLEIFLPRIIEDNFSQRI